jgi:hypothetical protein
MYVKMWNTDKITCAKFKWVTSIHVLCMLCRHPCCVWSSLCTCRLSYIGQTGRILNKKRKNTVRPADTTTPHYTDDDTTYTAHEHFLPK